MKTKSAIVIIAACLLLVTPVYSQVKRLNNQATTATEYLGWDAATGTTSKPVDVKNYFVPAGSPPRDPARV